MKVNFDQGYSYQQNFGMAIHSNINVNKIIKSRIKNSSELELLNKIIDKQANNPRIDITLMANPDNKSLSANIYTKSNNSDDRFFEQHSENLFSKIFGGGVVGFIKKMGKIADKANDKFAKKDLNYDDIFAKINK